MADKQKAIIITLRDWEELTFHRLDAELAKIESPFCFVMSAATLSQYHELQRGIGGSYIPEKTWVVVRPRGTVEWVRGEDILLDAYRGVPIIEGDV